MKAHADLLYRLVSIFVHAHDVCMHTNGQLLARYQYHHDGTHVYTDLISPRPHASGPFEVASLLL